MRSISILAVVVVFGGASHGIVTASESGARDHQVMFSQDADLASRIHQELMNDPQFNGESEDVRVDVYSGMVTLSGFLTKISQVKAAEQIARNAGANKIRNNLDSKEYRATN